VRVSSTPDVVRYKGFSCRQGNRLYPIHIRLERSLSGILDAFFKARYWM
jgi:hypothetical protein